MGTVRCLTPECSWCYEAGKLCAHLLLVCRSEFGLGRCRTRALGGQQRGCHSTMRLLPVLAMHEYSRCPQSNEASALARRASRHFPELMITARHQQLQGAGVSQKRTGKLGGYLHVGRSSALDIRRRAALGSLCILAKVHVLGMCMQTHPTYSKEHESMHMQCPVLQCQLGMMPSQG